MPYRTWVTVGLLTALALPPTGCFQTRSPGADAPDAPDPDGAGPTPAGGPGARPPGATDPGSVPADLEARLCLGGGECRGVSLERPDKLDLLFVVDNSNTMAPVQDVLAKAAPTMMAALVRGLLDDDDRPDLPPILDIQVGVVSSDMGIGWTSIDRCEPGGDDGRLVTYSAAPECAGEQPAVLAFRGPESVGALAEVLACKLRLGEEGCGFEQPLEAMLKALTPTESAFTFMGVAGRPGSELGHGSAENRGFLRGAGPDASMVAVVVVTGEDDCSAADTRVFTPTQELADGHPLLSQDYNLRCHFNGQALHPVARYVEGLQALRPGQPDRLFFAVVAGVPDDLVDRDVMALDDGIATAAGRDAFYGRVLRDPRMQEQVDVSLPKGSRLLVPSCEVDGVTHNPPRRLVDVAKALGAGAVVQSGCGRRGVVDHSRDLDAALLVVAERLSARMHGTCTDVAAARDADQRVACELVVALPDGQACDARSGMRGREGSEDVCVVEQLPFDDGLTGPGVGWYYDDDPFHVAACDGDGDNMIVTTPEVAIPAGARVVLDCS